MQSHVIYEEKVFAKGITIILTVTTIIMLILFFVMMLLIEPLAGVFFIKWPYLAVAVFLALLIINFHCLTIKLTNQAITVGIGFIQSSIEWEKVHDVFVDEGTSLKYGGWGLRVRKYGDTRRKVYSLMKLPRLILTLKEGKFGEIAFSTKNPEKLISVIKNMLGRSG